MIRNSITRAVGCVLLAHLTLVVSCRSAGDQRADRSQRLTVLSEKGGAPSDLDLASLRGNIAVLEFWGTYCAPCIAAIPHWNELVDTFDGRDVQFISVSDEGRETVERFIRRRPIKGTIALDTNRSFFKKYDIWGVPTTVILDREGEVIAVTSPQFLTEESLGSILQGQSVDLPKGATGDRVATGPPPEEEEVESEPLFEIRIAPRAHENYKSTTAGDTWWKAEGWSVRESIAFACGVDEKRVEIPDALADTYIDFRLRIPDHMGDALHDTLRDALAMTFGVDIERRTPQVEAYVMTQPAGRGPALLETAATGKSSYMRTVLPEESTSAKLECINQPMSRIARQFESMLGAPVIDETGIEGSFDFELNYDNNPAGIIKVVRDRLGLDLTLTQRPIETVVVLPRPKLSAEAGP